jgi:hypothetical protein
MSIKSQIFEGEGIMFNRVNMSKDNVSFLCQLEQKYENFFLSSDASENSVSPFFLWNVVNEVFKLNNWTIPLILSDDCMKDLKTNDDSIDLDDNNAWDLSKDQYYICLDKYELGESQTLKNNTLNKILDTNYVLYDDEDGKQSKLNVDESTKLFDLIMNEKNILCGKFLVYLLS